MPACLAAFVFFLFVSLLEHSPLQAQPSSLPVPAAETRIIVAPNWTPDEKAETNSGAIDDIKAIANAVTVDARLFEWRTTGENGLDAGLDTSRLDSIWSNLASKKFPYIMGMNVLTEGKRESLDWLEKKYQEIPVWQKALDGSHANGLDGTNASICMAHRSVRGEIQMAFEKIAKDLKANSAHDLLLAYSGVPQPRIARKGSKPGSLDGCDGQPSGYCVNPEHLAYWMKTVAEQWGNDIVAYNREFQTTYATFKDIPQPNTFTNPTKLSISYELGLIESLYDFSKWNLSLIHIEDPSVPILNNGASFNSILGQGVRNSYASFDAGSVFPFVPGGEIAAVPGLLASGAAILMDGHRSFTTAAISASALGIKDTWDASGQEYRLWFSQLAARFKQVYTAPMGWNESGSSRPRATLPDAFIWATQLGTIDVGQPVIPSVAIMTPYSSWCTDNAEPLTSEKAAYQQLYLASVDRVLVSELQIEKNWLEEHNCSVLILPHVRTLTARSLAAIHRWSQSPGRRLFLIGPFADKDSTLSPGATFITQRDELLASAGTRKVDDLKALSRMVRSALGNTQPVTPGIEMTATSEGYCLVNAGPFVGVNRVTAAPPVQKFDVMVDGHTIQQIPVQYFTFLHKVGPDWMATTIDAQGAITTTKVNGTT